MRTPKLIREREEMVERAGQAIDRRLVAFVESELLIGLSIDPDQFWQALSRLVRSMTPRNRALLAHRDELQERIDAWHRERAGEPHDAAAYRRFLGDIGYLCPEGDDFVIETTNIDREIATIAGPQLVVPVTNARYALNAANARWGSLYDALYGTDAVSDPPPPGPYDEDRGDVVVRWAKRFLDDHVGFDGASHSAVECYEIVDGHLVGRLAARTVPLLCVESFVGYQGPAEAPTSVLLTHNGLRIEIVIDRMSRVGATDPAGVADVRLESAVTTIIDFEDSVSTVDAADKVVAYRNWLQLMNGTLTANVRKGDRVSVRALEPNRTFRTGSGGSVLLSSQALLLARNVGIHMTTSSVRDANGDAVYEGLLDALLTVTAAMHDLARPEAERNSAAGSVYIVKPKLHGPDEVAFAIETFAAVERYLGLTENTVKVGIMDEERRTSTNLRECIRKARSRVAFINTGFLDRTGDEIHTSMEAGAMVPKADMKAQCWIAAYEERNVAIGLSCGFAGKAQIGKGMWAAPDRMRDMLRQKSAHPRSGANCAWVPSPTAATLHAIHYHRVDVFARQGELSRRGVAPLADVLAIPVASGGWSADERQRELDNNVQGILGYVVRWVDQGVGCSKVLDVNGVALMEDRATCRISSQHIANWLRHGVVTSEDVEAALARMAAVVDGQNVSDPLYRAMAPSLHGPAFQAARELIFNGCRESGGYTETALNNGRRIVKATDGAAATRELPDGG